MKLKILCVCGFVLFSLQTLSQSLIKEIQNGKDENVQKLIAQNSSIINTEKDKKFGYFPIHEAVLKNRNDYVKTFVEKGADINLQDNRENTALIMAVADNQPEIFSTLMDAKPDVNKQNFKGNSSLIIACRDNKEDFANALLGSGSNVDLKNLDGNTALIYAVKNDNTSLVAKLLKSEVDVVAKNNENKSALDFIVSEEMRWLAGTESYLKDYVISLSTLAKYQTKFPQSESLPVLARPVLKNLTSLNDIFKLGDMNILEKSEIESKSSTVVVNYDDANKFHTKFPNSKFNKQVVLNSLQESKNNEIRKIRDLFGTDFNIDSTDFSKLDADDYKKSKFMNAQFVLNPLLTVDDIDDLFQKYRWLNYNNKQQVIMENYWNISAGTLQFGNVVLDIMHTLPQKKDFGISETQLTEFINRKLQIEVERNVSILNTEKLGANNPEWDKWLANNTYTAGMVQEKGNIEYLVYGKLNNNSIFDLPVQVSASGDLLKHSEISGTGLFSNLLLFIGSCMGMETSSTKKVGSASNVFYIPALPSNSSGLYSVLVNFGEGSTHSGVNLFDWFKSTSTTEFSNVQSNRGYSNHILSQAEADKQEQWQLIAKNGFPTVKLYDWLRGTEVKDAEWQEKWQKILEERARAAAEAKRIEQETFRSVAVIAGKENCDITKTSNSADVSINMHDATGVIFQDICTKSFSASITDKNGKSKSFEYSDMWSVYGYTPPVKISVSFQPDGCEDKFASIVILIAEGGNYTVHLKK